MNTIQDPVFGQLHYDGGWKTQVYIPMLDKQLRLTINNSLEHPPQAGEHQLWQWFMGQQEILKGLLERVIFDYYNRRLEQHRMPYSKEEEEQYVPTLHQPSEVWKLVKPRSLWIELEDDESCSLTISFATHWDEEHGMDVMFYQNQIGISDAGAHWLNRDRYDLNGTLLFLDGQP